jgi:hypothetical protein
MTRRGKYASNTAVSSEQSRMDIEKVLKRYGANAFGYSWFDGGASIEFRIGAAGVQMSIILPKREEFFETNTGRVRRSNAVIEKSWEQACRQRWRALKLVVQAKLEAVDCGISTLQREFLADLQLPDGRTIQHYLLDQVNSGQLALPEPESK